MIDTRFGGIIKLKEKLDGKRMYVKPILKKG